MRKIMLFTLAFALLSLTVTGAGAAPEKPYKISLLLGTLDNPFWITVRQAAEMAAEEFGVELTVLGVDREGDGVQQTSQLEDRVAAGDDAIVIAIADSTALIPGVKTANDAGIPVIAIDKSIDEVPDGGKVESVIMTDNIPAAAMGATFVANKIGGKGTVLFIEGRPGGQTADDRKKGAAEGYAQFPDIELISLTAEWETAKAQNVTEDTLTANPDLAAIQTANGLMAMGAQTAAAAQGLDIPIVAYDGLSENLKMVADGRLAGDVAQFPARMGYLGVEYAIRVIEGKPVPAVVDSGAFLITQDNVNAFNAGLYGK